jgi:hypothetical protein
VPTEATYEDVGEFWDRFGDHNLTAAYWSQLKARVQTSGGMIQEFAAAVEQMARRALVELPGAFIQKWAADAFIDGLRDREMRQDILMGGEHNKLSLKSGLETGTSKRVTSKTAGDDQGEC